MTTLAEHIIGISLLAALLGAVGVSTVGICKCILDREWGRAIVGVLILCFFVNLLVRFAFSLAEK